MKVEVHFISFPKSDLIRTNILHRISEAVEKYIHDMSASVKVFFHLEGAESHIKISLIAPKIDLWVNASSNDLGEAVESTLNKLDASLRKVKTKKEHQRDVLPPHINPDSPFSAINLRYEKLNTKEDESVFDKYEISYISEFEDLERKPKPDKKD